MQTNNFESSKAGKDKKYSFHIWIKQIKETDKEKEVKEEIEEGLNEYYGRN